ncbi:hypothetical protein XarbCFBP8130_15045 [Xanthomonas arboricola]|nr:hypothetical protein XarbCFBP8130_15045 [Xanthomonas arboricola]
MRRGRSEACAPVARKPCPLAPAGEGLAPFSLLPSPFSHQEKVPEGRMRVRRHAHAAIGRDQASPLTRYTAGPSTTRSAAHDHRGNRAGNRRGTNHLSHHCSYIHTAQVTSAPPPSHQHIAIRNNLSCMRWHAT